jgi:Common central domain of tyrosinase
MRKTTRRGFLESTGKAVTAAVVGAELFGAGRAFGGPVFVRRNVDKLKANDPILVSYRKAIKKMRALPDTNPLSWAFQAAIHGTTITPVLPDWNKCEHGTEFFWSWHRMYLYWFERIVRKMSEDKDWAIPYWNWAPGSDFKLPAPFRDTTSDLYTVHRDPAINAGTGSLNAAAVSVTGSFALTNFFTTNLNIQGPHGSVHLEVGGTPAGWMWSVATAGQDPIFYVHHSNVDRLWDLWLAQGGGRSDPTMDATWTGKTYTFFDESGAAVKMSACEILRAAEQLQYKYEGEPPQVLEFCKRRRPLPIWEFEQVVLFQLPGPPVELGGQEVTVPIPMREIREKAANVAASASDMLLLQLEGIEAEQQPGVSWGIWVGLGKGAEAVAEIPSHVGALSLFGAGIRGEMKQMQHEFMAAKAVFPLNRAMQEALKSGGESVEIRFVPLGILVDGKATRPEVKAPVRIGKISLVIEKGTEAK